MRRCRRIAFEELVRFDRTKGAVPARLVAGVDEAGRGALAGPVVAAAVICEPGERLSRVQDSKLVREGERERLYAIIIEHSIAYGIGIVESGEIDRTNVLRSALAAMRIAVEALDTKPAFVLVDGNKLPEIDIPAEAITGGDGKSFVIAAASILAKVTRDRIMRAHASTFRGYGFKHNKGYGTRQHIEAIRKRGLTELHRRSFTIHADPER
ncbi:MAG TPA: ribonuclease HII [Candidatus Bathyarchaeia archaeon]|nr:ribonuclease HII [Candidatus Bathyarchaeia archaeon]